MEELLHRLGCKKISHKTTNYFPTGAGILPSTVSTIQYSVFATCKQHNAQGIVQIALDDVEKLLQKYRRLSIKSSIQKHNITTCK